MAQGASRTLPEFGRGGQTVTTLLGVFAAALLAATILPFYSEVAVTAAILAGANAWSVFFAASAGNTLGAVVNALIGRLVTTDAARQRLRISERQYAKASKWFNKWGVWSLLLAWLPVGGDALTVVAGAMRVRWWVFLTLVFAGKAGRYAVLIWLLSGTDAGR